MTESRSEYIKEEESVDDTNGLLEIDVDIEIESMKMLNRQGKVEYK